MTKHHAKPFGALAALALFPLSAGAAVVYTTPYAGTASEVSSSNELAYQGDVSSTDLINNLIGSNAVYAGFFISNGATAAELDDGIHGRSFATAGNSVEGAYTNIGATATYTLGGGANALGYDITSIQSIAAWNGAGYGNQDWTVEVRLVGSSTFVKLADVAYEPFASTGAGATKVTLSPTNATGVDQIRFTANSVDSFDGRFVWREMDVFGTATAIPEPSSALLALGGLAFLLRRRRK